MAKEAVGPSGAGSMQPPVPHPDSSFPLNPERRLNAPAFVGGYRRDTMPQAVGTHRRVPGMEPFYSEGDAHARAPGDPPFI